MNPAKPKRKATRPTRAAAKTSRPRRREQPRPAAAGDTAPSVEPAKLGQFVVSEAVDAAQTSKVTAVKDIIHTCIFTPDDH